MLAIGIKMNAVGCPQTQGVFHTGLQGSSLPQISQVSKQVYPGEPLNGDIRAVINKNYAIVSFFKFS